MFALLLSIASYILIINAEEWNLLETGPWGAREGLMGTFYDGYIWMSGGRYSPPGGQNINQSIFYNDVWKLEASCIQQPSTCKWQLVTNMAPWEGRAYHIMFNHTVDSISYMYIAAGQNLSTFYNDVWRTTDGMKWEQVLANNQGQFHVRAGLAAISYPSDGYIYLGCGCYDEFPNRQTLNDLWRSKDGSKWELIINNQPDILMHVRSGPRIQIWKNILYIVAGEHGFSETTQLADVWDFNLDTIDDKDINNNQWELILPDAKWANRSGHGFVIDNDGIFWLIAGYLDLHDLWRSRDLGKTWTEVDDHVFNCNKTDVKCGRYDFWAQLDDNNDLFLYGGDSNWNTFGGESNQTFENNLDTYPVS